MSHNFRIIISLFGSMILAFGLYHIHSMGVITEGGILGLTLLLHHWFQISPALSGLVLNGACYLVGVKVLGKSFLFYSILSSVSFSVFYTIFERQPLLFPFLTTTPLVTALIGAFFVGVGVGLCVKGGGAPGGDDALAMAISHKTKWSVEWIYLGSDLLVLFLSLTYIPVQKILYSLVTVILSGQIIGWIQKFPKAK